MLFWIIIAIAAAMTIYAIAVCNRLVRMRQMVNEAWSGIDVQLKRRSDLVPNLAITVKASAAHERLQWPRARAASAMLSPRRFRPPSPKKPGGGGGGW
jgi:hypothetical protein